jgi:hypothetical protein
MGKGCKYIVILLLFITTAVDKTKSFAFHRQSCCGASTCRVFTMHPCKYDDNIQKIGFRYSRLIRMFKCTHWRKITNKAWLVTKQHILNGHEQDFAIQEDNDNEFVTSDNARPTTSIVGTVSRRNYFMISMKFCSSIAVCDLLLFPVPENANSAFITLSPQGGGNEINRRQLELCLVIILRVIYWAKNTIDTFTAATSQSIELRRKLYLEARLCSKAMLTGKLGDGSTSKTYTLSSLQVPLCLTDIEWYAENIGKKNLWSKREYDSTINAKISLYEGLANIVEFDGLETLIDPSPRATLTLAQYTEQKFLYIKRTLSEIIVPSAVRIVTAFGSQPLQIAEQYTKTYYKNEVYDDIIVPQTTPTSIAVQPTIQQQEYEKSSEGSINEKDYDGSY